MFFASKYLSFRKMPGTYRKNRHPQIHQRVIALLHSRASEPPLAKMRDLSGCAAVSLRPSPDYHGRARMSEFGMHEQGGLVELLTKHYATQIIPNSGPNCFR